MKVLLYTVFKELATELFVARDLMYRSTASVARSSISEAISLKTPAKTEAKRGDGLSKTSSPVSRTREASN
jgi:hypothetical protein